MAGFFGLFDYSKPGPGIPKDAPPKPRIVVFFGIYFRKFWNLIKMNLLLNIFNLPATALALFTALFIFGQPNAVEDPNTLLIDLFFKFFLASLVLCIPIITVGPVQAGFTYVMRNYAREEHAFLWGDFKEHALKNFKQGLIVSIIDYIVLVLMTFALKFYFTIDSTLITKIAAGVAVLAFTVFVMAHIYIYPMLITFQLSIKQLYRNAFIFAFIKFIPNLLIILLSIFLIGLTYGFFMLFNPIIGVFFFIFLTPSTIGILTNFYAYPKLKKYIIDKLEVNEGGEAEDSGEEAEETEAAEENGEVDESENSPNE